MKVRLWPMYLQKSLSIFLVEEKCQVKLQDIRFIFVSYWVVTKYFVRINAPAWSHFHHVFFCCKVFCQMCLKRSGRRELTAQIPPLLGFSCLQSVWGSDCIFIIEILLSKDQLWCFHWKQVVIAWDDRIIRITSLFLFIFLKSFTVEEI